MKATVGVAGASGYSGGELVRLVVSHPEFELAWVGGEASAGKAIGDVHPWLKYSPVTSKVSALPVESVGDSHDLSGLDLLFTCLPQGHSSKFLAALGSKRPQRVVDLGPDFRLREDDYGVWYGNTHPLVNELGEWVYGFTEGYRDQISDATRVANPGCYAYATLLALFPLAREGLIDGVVFVDGKSGLSGAGRRAEQRLLLSEATDDTTPYAVEGHRHQPEIERTLKDLAGPCSLVFVPHLVPMARGLLITAYVPLVRGSTKEQVSQVYAEHYAEEPFVVLVESPPHTKEVRGSNMAALFAVVRNDSDTGLPVAVVTVAIDNLGKGAGGSAVQNANVMFGFDEKCGLLGSGLWP